MASSTYPFLDNGFHIRWSTLTPDTVEADISLALEKAQENVKALAGDDWQAQDLTFANTELGGSFLKIFMTSRGCPFTCTYCFNNPLNEMQKAVEDAVRETSIIRSISHPRMVSPGQ